MKKILLRLMFLVFTLLLCSQLSAQKKNRNVEYTLPQLLIANSGKGISNINEWETLRRPQILEMFKKHVYGRTPDKNLDIKFRLTQENKSALNNKAIMKEVEVLWSYKNKQHSMSILIYLPKNQDKPTPLFLGMNFYGNHTIIYDPSVSITKSHINNKSEFCIENNRGTHLSRGVRSYRWPIERMIERGYGIAAIYYGDLDPDFDDGFNNGIHKLFSDSNVERKPDDWGSISTWAYGLSKAMDYFEKDEDIDHERIAVIGHSRLGKTALWAGAQDQRFAITISNNSGCGGAALSRRKSGETVEAINKVFPHWFCENFHSFNNKEDKLPIDQHMLVALVAPRPVYIGSAVQDKWADPEGEYLSLFHAGQVYKLYNENCITDKKLPKLNNPVLIGKQGYHIRSGRHDLTKYDWERYMDFADLHFN